MSVESNNSNDFKHPGLKHILGLIGVGTLAITVAGFVAYSVDSRADRETNKLHAVEAEYNNLKRDYAERSEIMEQFCDRMYINLREMEKRDMRLSPRQYRSRQFYDACLKRARGR